MTRLLSVARSTGAWPLSLIAIGMFALFAVGCAGSLPPGLEPGGGSGGMGGGGTGGMMTTAPDVMCSDGMMATAKIVSTCGQTAVCHDNAAAASGMLTLNNAATLVGNLLNKKPNAKSPLCAAYADPYLKEGSNPPTGLFLEKLKMMPACGASMPFAKPVLPQADIDCLTKWAMGVTAL